MDFTGKKVALLGFGLENRSLLPYLQKRGAKITVVDKREDLIIERGIDYISGPRYLSRLSEFDVIFRSPGIPFLTLEIQQAIKKGAVVTSQTNLFFEECSGRIIGITGTKGKSTTVSLIQEMLETARMRGEIKGRIYLAGNIGTPFMEILGQVGPNDLVVAELSSFQLQDFQSKPSIAVILNMTPDHLDHHGGYEEYKNSKKNILKNQGPNDAAVLNFELAEKSDLAKTAQARLYFFSSRQEVPQGAYIGNGEVILRTPNHSETVVKVAGIHLKGAHNLENVAAAVTAAHLAGASLPSLQEGLSNFKGLKHRLQFVAEINGVKFYDDSKSTTPESAIAAIASFEEPIVLIAGGASKNLELAELANKIMAANVKKVICLGEVGRELRNLLDVRAPDKALVVEQSMKAAVSAARSFSERGDIVLLSPAAASFDMFKNAEERGQQFQEAIRNP